jgi:hypothetical protein
MAIDEGDDWGARVLCEITIKGFIFGDVNGLVDGFIELRHLFDVVLEEVFLFSVADVYQWSLHALFTGKLSL